MYTKEPNYFEYQDDAEIEKAIDLSYPDYCEVDWDWLESLEVKQTLNCLDNSVKICK